ncbi:MAG TPA: thiol-disulfide oxidoreductase DCC family protein [Chitinophagaceae bacterium]|nr:thiol-disulfide oxidoreductase DCC family protein [Chitinophagaceae bacterium]
MQKPIVLFDGVCNLCSRAVQFIIRHDKKKQFMFTSLQSEAGQKILAQYNFPLEELNSFILIENNKAYTRSTGALKIAKKLNGIWPWLYNFIIIPKIFRDSIYDLFAKNRYKWFGKKDACMIPTQELKARFLN